MARNDPVWALKDMVGHMKSFAEVLIGWNCTSPPQNNELISNDYKLNQTSGDSAN